MLSFQEIRNASFQRSGCIMVTQRKGEEPWLAGEVAHPDLLSLPRRLLGCALPAPRDQDTPSADMQAAPGLPCFSPTPRPRGLPTFQSLPTSSCTLPALIHSTPPQRKQRSDPATGKQAVWARARGSPHPIALGPPSCKAA